MKHLIRRKRVVVPSVIFILLLFGIYLAWMEFQSILDLNITLRKVNHYIVESNKRDFKQRKQLKQQLDVAITERQSAEFELYKHRVKDVIIYQYKQWGLLQEYTWITPNHIKSVIDYCFKYYPLVSGDRIVDTIDLPLMMIAICYNETNFNPKMVYDKNTDGSFDFGITQINQKCLEYCKLSLPKHLQDRDIKTDTEANIAGRYEWIKQRKAWSKSWLSHTTRKPFSQRGWAFYDTILKVK